VENVFPSDFGIRFRLSTFSQLNINSSELRATGFDLREVIPLQLEVAARGGQRTRGAALKQIHGMGTRRYVLSVDNDSEFRSRCE
jgi:hypothetical protein